MIVYVGESDALCEVVMVYVAVCGCVQVSVEVKDIDMEIVINGDLVTV